MGVEREYFIFYGVKSDYKFVTDVISEKEKEELISYGEDYKNYVITDNKSPFKVFALSDGMGGDYSCYGVLYKRYGKDRWGEDVDINTSFTDSDIQKLKDAWEKVQEENKIDIGDLQPALHIIRYYT